ncbi:MAG: NAD(P)-binding protein [Thermoleophilaceae bacterium]
MAVLGGGVGGLTAAFELTATPELRERFKVTVYQLGWRLGGKGASGRNPAYADRIEEHGLHVWFGFYDNAFRVMRDAYAELDRAPGAPLATFEDAFEPCDQLVLYDRQDGGWHAFRFDCPRNPLRPGDPGELPTFWEMAATACRWALTAWRNLREARDDLEPATPEEADLVPDWFEDLARDLAGELLEVPFDLADHLLGLAERLASRRARHTDHGVARQAAEPLLLVTLLKAFRDGLWSSVVADRHERDPELRFVFTAIDAGVSTIAGIVEDGVLEHGFDAINDEEWAHWLRRHGAKEVTLGRTPEERSPVLRSVYDVAFAYPEGDIGNANCAAGTATSDLLRLVFSYRGSIMYKMQAGMGDVVFTPLYEVLRRRGVRFEFFHAVTNLGVAAQANRIETVEVVPQVELAAGVDGYEPLVPVYGLPCWPSEPHWEQLEDGDALREAGVSFEWELNPLGHPARTLTRGRDFDEVVLGIPVGALPDICPELMQRDERFRRGVESAVTVGTQAFQLWSGRSARDLGWRHSGNSVAGCYVEPLDTYCDMSHLIPRESWSSAEVATIGYFCGVLEEVPGEGPAEASERVRRNALEFVENDLQTLWPAARRDGSFDWNALVDRRGASGAERFDAQYWRANVTPWERYVLTPAGSVEHRLPSGDSGFDNLTLAGDWTRNGIDGGCVEAAVISGMHAAQALTGIEQPIPGTSSRWLRPRTQELPAYVEFGGRATAPTPFSCMGGNLRALVLEGDPERMDALVERMFNAPAGGALDYRALGSRVLLMVGSFERVTSLTAPYDRWGAVRETQASFFVPVVAGRDLGDVFLAERVLMAVPYILVDNPMSYLGGRETYGYAKTMGRFTPASGLGERVLVHAFGGDFGRDRGADWHEFVEVAAGPARGGAGREAEVSGPIGLLRKVVGDLPAREREEEIVLAGVRLPASLLADVAGRRVGQVFLKQFRDAADGTRACYQSVVEAPVRVRRVRARPSAREWAVRIHPLDSHPIDQELGLADQRALLAFDVEIDFDVEDGIEVGRVAARPDGAPTSVTPVPVADGSPIEAAARYVWRELNAITRASLGRLRGL